MAKSVKRLYQNFHPESYDLSIALDPKKMNFSGQVVIEGLKVGRPSKRLTFHQKNLKILSAKITHIRTKGEQLLKPERINYQKSFDEVRLHFSQSLVAGRYRVELKYTGQINSSLQGIYASTFKEKKTEKVIICTQFESHHAREALPCIDEPEAKSVFNLTLKTPAELSAVISNTDPISTKKTGGQVTTVFEPTPKMSSYLLAFVAGDLKHLEARTKNNVRVRTYATDTNVGFTKFALDCAVKTLDFYDEYFALPYPLSKCDLIALPDFASGAMENWGCITFREQALLVDPATTSLDLTQYVANVVAHELTHMWFGNLVTMRWWNDLWLNESFASWMSYLAVDHLFPDWKIWTQFVVEEQAVGLKLDSLENTHPVEVKISNPDEIRTVFDAISYEKGASVITMLEDYVGASNFRDGLRLYLSQHAYGNTETSDLWDALKIVSKKPVDGFMGRWTTSSGYPMVKASLSESNIHLEQHRFYLNPKAERQPTVWPVPLFSELDFGKNDPFIHRSINVPVANQPSSLILNKGRKGFYRVIYDDLTIKSLTGPGFMEQIGEVDRLGLLADGFEAAKAGYQPTLSALNLLKSYFDESSMVVWEAIAGNLSSVRATMDDLDLRKQMKPFIIKLVSKQLDRLGLSAKKNDSHFDRLLRPTIMALAASADEPSVLVEVERLFNYAERDSIDPDLRGVVYTTVGRRGAAKEFDILLKMHNASDSPEERLKLAAALTSFEQPALIKRSLEIIRSDSVRLQDVVYWISYSFANRFARDATWKWLKDNWDWLEQSMGQDLGFYRLPTYVARCYSSLEFLDKFKEFFAQRLSSAFDRPYKQAVETIEWQADWKQRDLADTLAFFKHWPKA